MGYMDMDDRELVERFERVVMAYATDWRKPRGMEKDISNMRDELIARLLVNKDWGGKQLSLFE
jgi:hypothetical protein